MNKYLIAKCYNCGYIDNSELINHKCLKCNSILESYNSKLYYDIINDKLKKETITPPNYKELLIKESYHQDHRKYRNTLDILITKKDGIYESCMIAPYASLNPRRPLYRISSINDNKGEINCYLNKVGLKNIDDTLEYYWYKIPYQNSDMYNNFDKINNFFKKNEYKKLKFNNPLGKDLLKEIEINNEKKLKEYVELNYLNNWILKNLNINLYEEKNIMIDNESFLNNPYLIKVEEGLLKDFYYYKDSKNLIENSEKTLQYINDNNIETDEDILNSLIDIPNIDKDSITNIKDYDGINGMSTNCKSLNLYSLLNELNKKPKMLSIMNIKEDNSDYKDLILIPYYINEDNQIVYINTNKNSKINGINLFEDMETFNEFINSVYKRNLNESDNIQYLFGKKLPKGDITLYHGTTINNLTEIFPYSYNAGKNKDKVKMSSFWFNKIEYAISFSLLTLIDSKLLIDVTIDNDMKVITRKSYKKEVLDLLKNNVTYVYEKTIDSSLIGYGHHGVFPEYTIDVPVKPNKKYIIQPNQLKNYLKFVSNEYYDKIITNYNSGNMRFGSNLFQLKLDKMVYYKNSKGRENKINYVKGYYKDRIQCYEITYKNLTIFEAFKKSVNNEIWKEFKNSDIYYWYTKPLEYGKNYKLFFKDIGYKLFMKKIYPIFIKYLNKKDIIINNYYLDESKIVYKDEYILVSNQIIKESYNLKESYNTNDYKTVIYNYENFDVNNIFKECKSIKDVIKISLQEDINRNNSIYAFLDNYNLNPDLKDYIIKEILPQYNNTIIDKGHDINHILNVINNSLIICKKLNENLDMSFVIASYHDIGLLDGDRELHHINSGKRFINDKNIKKYFSMNDLNTMRIAIEEHRASISTKSNIYSMIVSDADRLPLEINNHIIRSWNYNIKHCGPDAKNIDIFNAVYSHLKEKFGSRNAKGNQLWTQPAKELAKKDIDHSIKVLSNEKEFKKVLKKLVEDKYIILKNDNSLLL